MSITWANGINGMLTEAEFTAYKTKLMSEL